MRGEELQILGAMAGAGLETVGWLPGPTSKWGDRARQSGAKAFGTWLTGELYALVRYKSLAGRPRVEADWDPDAFAAGLERGRRTVADRRRSFLARSRRPKAGGGFFLFPFC